MGCDLLAMDGESNLGVDPPPHLLCKLAKCSAATVHYGTGRLHLLLELGIAGAQFYPFVGHKRTDEIALPRPNPLQHLLGNYNPRGISNGDELHHVHGHLP